MNDGASNLWLDPGWLDRCHKWIRGVLNQKGIAITGRIEQPHIQPWSTMLHVPTKAGSLYFKASAPALSHEAAVTSLLCEHHPDLLPDLLAIEPGRGWMLLADGGRRLRERFEEGFPAQRWMDILGRYAELQIEAADLVDALLAAGAPDRRLGQLPALYSGFLDDIPGLLQDQPDGLGQKERRRLEEAAPLVSRLCQDLRDYELPASIHHGDLHDGNIFLNGDQPIFFDWGDSFVTHPFFSMRTVLVSLENTFGYEEGHSDFQNYARAYLEPWEVFTSKQRLWEAYCLAERIWMLGSALAYRHLWQNASTGRGRLAGAVQSLLHEFLDANSEIR